LISPLNESDITGEFQSYATVQGVGFIDTSFPHGANEKKFTKMNMRMVEENISSSY